MLRLIPIEQTLEENIEFSKNEFCSQTLNATLSFYKTVGFIKPWICYYAKENDQLVGSAGFKGKPQNGQIEIAYGTFENFRKKGIGTQLCKLLVEIALETGEKLKVTARTLPERNYSTRILEKNSFKFIGIVNDPEDGDVWEWVYMP